MWNVAESLEQRKEFSKLRAPSSALSVWREMAKIIPISLGDVVRMKKAHPCGTNEWEVIKLGMDIGLRCRGCGHRVRLLRPRFDGRFRGFVRKGSEE